MRRWDQIRFEYAEILKLFNHNPISQKPEYLEAFWAVMIWNHGRPTWDHQRSPGPKIGPNWWKVLKHFNWLVVCFASWKIWKSNLQTSKKRCKLKKMCQTTNQSIIRLTNFSAFLRRNQCCGSLLLQQTSFSLGMSWTQAIGLLTKLDRIEVPLALAGKKSIYLYMQHICLHVVYNII